VRDTYIPLKQNAHRMREMISLLQLERHMKFSRKAHSEAPDSGTCSLRSRSQSGRAPVSVEDTIMKIQTSAVLLSLALVMGLGGSAVSAAVIDQLAATPIQYGQYPDRRDDYYPQDRYFPNDRRGGYYPPARDSYDAPLWRPGDVVPPDVLDFVVDDWEPRGLERPPGGHLWFRVGYQFLLVRERDRMISRVINFN
jgi:Ni/Co efflux regulator RcnB